VLGYPEQAGSRCDEAVDEARALRHDYSLVVSLGNACSVDLTCRRRRLLHERVEEMISVAAARGFPTWLARGRIYHGWLLADEPCRSSELAPMRVGLAELRRIGAMGGMGRYVCLLADACRRTDRASEGVDALDELMSATQPAGERSYEAELHRVNGELALSCGEPSRGESCFRRALDIARQQSAKAWELRAAVSLARLWAEQGERRKAHALLAPVHGWFTEGQGAPDLQEAKALLDALG
jgi:predicted ATPase